MRGILAFAASAIIASSAFAQATPAPAPPPVKKTEPKPAVQAAETIKKSMALIFSLGNFDAGGLDGFAIPASGAIGTINPLTYDRAWIGGKYGLSDAMFIRALGMFGWENGGATSFGILPGLQFYLTRRAPVDIYWGGELCFGMTFSQIAAGGDYSGMTFAPRAFAGAECFLKEGLSVSAEYRLGWNRMSGHWEPDAAPADDTVETTISTGSFGLILSFYF
ncbi:MAG: hypothetical protein NT080_05645 [Spirochaetes bacterium]|nr:hypothetical protein [Spirochaetota bacterium]